MLCSNSGISQGLDTYQEERVLKGSEENSKLRPDNPSGLDKNQERRVQSDKYNPITGSKPSGGGLDDAEMEQRGLESK